MVTLSQHTDTPWPHPIFWISLSNSVLWSFCSPCFASFFFFSWKTWILYGNKPCRSHKGTTIDTPLQQDKDKRRERRPSISLVSVAQKVNARMMIVRSLGAFRTGRLKRNRYWSSRLAVLHREGGSALVGFALCSASLWDPGRRGFCCCPHCRKVTDSYSPLTEHQ